MSDQLLTGGRAHWRDDPTPPPVCTVCDGWGTVMIQDPYGWVSCEWCDATGKLELANFNARGLAA